MYAATHMSGEGPTLGRLKYMDLAEREGFEPSVGLTLRLISSQVHSTTLPPLRTERRLYLC